MKIIIPKEVLQNIQNEAMTLLAPDLEKEFRLYFEEIKKEMIAEFMNHPVTEEIMNGPNAENSSGTLNGRSGNLFSFIGFEENDDPISPIIDILDSTTMKFANFSRIGARLTIRMPSAETIFDATPMPWASGRSWAKGIESGISGLGYYIQKYRQGRSMGGVQVDHQVGIGRFQNTSYISTLINKYFKEFSSIDGAAIRIKKL